MVFKGPFQLKRFYDSMRSIHFSWVKMKWSEKYSPESISTYLSSSLFVLPSQASARGYFWPGYQAVYGSDTALLSYMNIIMSYMKYILLF